MTQRANSLEKTLMLGKIEGKRRRGQRMRWLDGIINSMDMCFSKLREIVKDREAWSAAVHGVRHDSATEQQQWFSRVLDSRKTKLNLVCTWVFRLRFPLSAPVLT